MFLTEEEFENLERTKLRQDIIDNIKQSIVPTERLLKNSKILELNGTNNLCGNIFCYPYALGIMYNECFATKGKNKFLKYEPGFTDLTNVQPRSFLTNLMSLVKQDLDNMKISYREISLNGDISLKQGEYLIKVFLKDTKWMSTVDYHFVRYSPKDHLWFHKMSFLQPQLINDCESYYFMNINFEEKSIYPKEPKKIIANHGMYEPLGYFAIKEIQ